ncbi:MAG: phosphatase PAP2 family protein [Acidobacteriia bacterium]|nr:phosphatase PAP2 family protein [Terriglobia bacterium]
MKKLTLTSQEREWLLPFGAYLLIVVTAYYRVHELYDSDFAFLILILFAVILGRLSSFISDWLPAVMLLFSYEYLHGYADKVIGRVHSTDVIAVEQKLFGTPVIAVWLQRWLYNPAHPHWYDKASAVIYFAHSFVVLFVGFALWFFSRDKFRIWVRLFVYLSFAGFTTYVLFPAMPPWMASQQHLIPPIHKIIDEVLPDGTQGVVSTMTSNLVAAMPSLHAAFPMLGFLFMLRYFRKIAPLYGLYSLAVFFAILYTGEHFIVDTIAGIGYAVGIFYLDDLISYLKRRWKEQRRITFSLELPVPKMLHRPSPLWEPIAESDGNPRAEKHY